MSTQARMPRCAVAALFLAVIALLGGFGGTLAGATSVARPMFFLFLFFAVVSLILARPPGRTTRGERCGNARKD